MVPRPERTGTSSPLARAIPTELLGAIAGGGERVGAVSATSGVVEERRIE